MTATTAGDSQKKWMWTGVKFAKVMEHACYMLGLALGMYMLFSFLNWFLGSLEINARFGPGTAALTAAITYILAVQLCNRCSKKETNK